MERGIHHNRHNNGRSLEMLREEMGEVHGSLMVHGGGNGNQEITLKTQRGNRLFYAFVMRAGA